jgi:hypothetical protein
MILAGLVRTVFRACWRCGTRRVAGRWDLEGAAAADGHAGLEVLPGAEVLHGGDAEGADVGMRESPAAGFAAGL